MLLAFDTATPAVTVAVADGDNVLAGSTTIDARRHGELLAPMIEAALSQAGVDRKALTAIAVGTGPGPFTGLRVGLVTARTLGAVLDIPVLGVCTLDTIALGSGLTGDFRVVTDARRREVHWAAYRARDGSITRVEGPYVASPVEASFTGPVVGAGAEQYAEQFPGRCEPLHPDAADLAHWVARGFPTTAPDPLYLRRPDAREPGVRKPALS